MGAGNTGLSTALKLKLDGHEVCLYDLDKFSSATEELHEEISLIYDNNSHYLRLDLVTNNINEALDFSKYIILCVPAYAHKEFAKELSNKVTEDHIVILMPGTLGSLEMRNIFENHHTKN